MDQTYALDTPAGVHRALLRLEQLRCDRDRGDLASSNVYITLQETISQTEFTPQERTVLHCMYNDHNTIHEIATALGVSERTVQQIARDAYEKIATNGKADVDAQ